MVALTLQVQAHQCNVIYDSNFVSQVLRDLSRKPTVRVERPAEVRAALSLSQTMNIAVVSPSELTLQNRPSAQLGYTREGGFQGKLPKDFSQINGEYFRNKVIFFFGVSPSIVGNVSIRVAEGYSTVADIVFLSDTSHVREWMMGKEVFATHVSSRAGFIPTGRIFRGYHSHRRVSDRYIRQTVPMIECEEKTILNLLPEKVIRSLNVLTIKNFKEKYHLTGLKVPYSELLYSRIVDKMSTSRVIEIDLRAMMRRHDVFFLWRSSNFFFPRRSSL